MFSFSLCMVYNASFLVPNLRLLLTVRGVKSVTKFTVHAQPFFFEIKTHLYAVSHLLSYPACLPLVTNNAGEAHCTILDVLLCFDGCLCFNICLCFDTPRVYVSTISMLRRSSLVLLQVLARASTVLVRASTVLARALTVLARNSTVLTHNSTGLTCASTILARCFTLRNTRDKVWSVLCCGCVYLVLVQARD